MKKLQTQTLLLTDGRMIQKSVFESTTAKTLLGVAGLIWCYAAIAYLVQTSYGWVLGYAAFFVALYQVLRYRNQPVSKMKRDTETVVHHHHYIVQNHYHQKQNSSENKGYVRCEEIRE